MEQDLYQILGIRPEATEAEVQKAFRGLAKKYHPDVNPGNKTAEQRFKEVSLAYEVLKDTEKRKRYDQMRLGGYQKGPFGPETFSDLGLGDLFSQIFGSQFGEVRFDMGRGMGGQFARRPLRRDEEAELPLTFVEAALGGERSIATGDGRRLRVKIPPGIETGAKIRLSGQASGGIGDLNLVVKVASDPQFQRDGLNVVIKVPITFSEAVLGGEVEVPTLAGKGKLRIPKGVSSGTRLKLSGKGIHQSGRIGDELVELVIKVPKQNDPKYAEAAELLRGHAFNPRSNDE